MPTRRSWDIPPEIWLLIASHLSQHDVLRLAHLNRTFAALAQEFRDSEARETLLFDLSEISSSWPTQLQLVEAVARRAAYNLAQQVFHRIQTNSAQRVHQIVWFSFPNAPTRRDSGLWDSLVRPLRIKFTKRLSNMYENFTSVQHLTILHEARQIAAGPGIMDFVYRDSMWTALAANLRQLSIYVADASFAHFLPTSGSTVLLPRLEVMRLAFTQLRIWPSSRMPLETGCDQVARLYTSARESLHTLDLRFKGFDAFSSPLSNALLPPRVVFSNLKSFVLHVDEAGPRNTPLAPVVVFVRRHASTLRRLHLFGVLPTVQELAQQVPRAFSAVHFTTELPVLAFSFAASPTDSAFLLDPSDNSASVKILRMCTLSVDWMGPTRNLRAGLVPNLRHLALHEHAAVESEHILVLLAETAPQLVSLSLHHRGECTRIRKTVENAAQLDRLRRWQLKDVAVFSLAQASQILALPHMKPTWWFMRHMTELMPSIESFFGTGHMRAERPGPGSWRRLWLWEENVYVD